MNNKMLKDLQEYHYSLKDESGNWRKEPVGFVYRARASKESIKILKDVLTIIMNSDKLHEETKIFISHYGLKFKEVNEISNEVRQRLAALEKRTAKKMSYSNTLVRLQEDNNSLDALLGNGILRNIIYGYVENERETNKKIKVFKSIFGECTNARNNLMIRIDDTVKGHKNSYSNNEDFFGILKSIESYLVQRHQLLEASINGDRDFVSYFNYLLSERGLLDDSVQTDRERLLHFLNNEDYITDYTNESWGNEDEYIIEEELDTSEEKTDTSEEDEYIVEEIDTLDDFDVPNDTETNTSNENESDIEESEIVEIMDDGIVF